MDSIDGQVADGDRKITGHASGEASGRASTEPEVRQFCDWNILSFGIHSFGFESTDSERVVVTRWIVFCFVPILPWRRIESQYIGEANHFGSLLEQIGMVTHEFQFQQRLPLSLSSIIATYCAVMLGLIVAAGPAALTIFWAMQGAANWIDVTLLIIALFWMVGFPFAVVYVQKQQLQATWSRERQHALEMSKQVNQTHVRQQWQQKHVLPESTFVCALVIGMLPGALIAIWLGWKPDLLVIVSAIVTLLIWAGFDQILVTHRNRDEAMRQVNPISREKR